MKPRKVLGRGKELARSTTNERERSDKLVEIATGDRFDVNTRFALFEMAEM